ncbi:MAG: beta-galactosidase [Clostridiaceae bacterium]|nr:beta-galactosidase [Clostridiaceae bacterium]
MKIGVDYYPEQWDEKLWEEDADKMKEAGIGIVRMAEFAWSRLEPEEGEYDFSWLDRAVRLFEDRKIEVFLCTPTNCPPQWMFERYPEIIQVDKTGKRIPIGIRGHRCLNSPVYRSFCQKMIVEMVSRYKDYKAVIGYQIDNELEANHCCCPVCADKFRSYIQAKYKTIHAVNQAYGNTVWSGEYSDFSQITPPFGKFQTWLNPSYMLDFHRYASESTADYVNFQRQCIHSIDPDALITTNNWLCENMPDFYDLFEPLDFVSYDNYPAAVLPDNPETLYSHAFHLDLMRGIKKKNFWIMEQLSGGLGSWMPMSPMPKPGMIKGYSLQAIAHGADAVIHFRWRTAVSGAEMFWHGLLDHSNVPGRRYQEFCDLCREVEQLQELSGSVVQNSVAILYSSEQEYAFKIQPQVEGMDYFTQLRAYHDAFTALGIGVDIVDWHSTLAEYRVVVAPTLLVTDSQIISQLHNFVREGGRLILTNRSGVKDIYNKCIMDPLPTVFSDLTGVTVKEYNPIGTQKQKIVAGEQGGFFDRESESGETFFCTLWCDILDAADASVLARYGEDYYKGEAAITEHACGKGMVYYVGTVLNRSGMRSLAGHIARQAGLSVKEGLPFGVERTVRQKDGRKWIFYFNNTDAVKRFCVEEKGTLLFDEELPADGELLTFRPFEMKIIRS